MMHNNKSPKIYSRGCPEIMESDESTFSSFTDGCNKLNIYNWLEDIDHGILNNDLVEIRFKNTRKGFYSNANQLRLKKGDIVAVEASPGHDIGIVSLTGDLVYYQMHKNNIDPAETEFKKIYRKAKPVDTEKWYEAINMEQPTMIKARQIADELKLAMKIGDVEFQGDKTKAIFYYIADERVDFRELIKVLAENFRVRIEMRQIGARQEAGRIGGIGPCGRELCCATWMSNFKSVTTNSARYQDVSLNPQKLAGQCGKLKCCLNYELPCYMEALEDFPDLSVKLETADGLVSCQKRDIFRRIMWFTFDSDAESASNFIPLSVEKVKEYIALNKSGKTIESLQGEVREKTEADNPEYKNVVGEDSITRFEDKNNKQNHRKKKKHPRNKNKHNRK